jgi:hypothetical protein
MNDVVMLEAALFQLKTAINSVTDEMVAPQLRLSMAVLSNAVESAGQSPSAAAVNDVEFALNDVHGMVGELSAVDAANVTPALEMFEADVRRLKETTSLSPAVVHGIRALQAKLRSRGSAIERQTYRPEGAAEDPLPHPPEQLRSEAVPLRQQLAAAGFATPALDGLIAEPASLRFHSISDIINELDVIAGP